MPEPEHPLDLVRELREICDAAEAGLAEAVEKLEDLARRVHAPDLPAEARDLGFRVCEVYRGGDYMLVGLACNLPAAVAMFESFVAERPNREWVLRWGMFTPRHYSPPPGLTYDPAPPRAIG
jgi:hypothetical protein